MKPFDLEAAKRGEPVATVSGLEVFVLGVGPGGDLWAFIGCEPAPRAFGVSGTVGGMLGHPLALRMAPKKRTVWVNLRADKAGPSTYYDSQEEADRFGGAFGGAAWRRIGNKAWPLEIEE